MLLTSLYKRYDTNVKFSFSPFTFQFLLKSCCNSCNLMKFIHLTLSPSCLMFNSCLSVEGEGLEILSSISSLFLFALPTHPLSFTFCNELSYILICGSRISGGQEHHFFLKTKGKWSSWENIRSYLTLKAMWYLWYPVLLGKHSRQDFLVDFKYTHSVCKGDLALNKHNMNIQPECEWTRKL